MPIGVEAEATQFYEEARSVLGSLITQMISIAREIIRWVMNIGGTIISWAGEHPLAMIMLVCNVAIWLS
jgi:hypothetical protein